MKKKAMSLLLATAMTASLLAGCGSSSNAGTASNGAADQTTTESNEASDNKASDAASDQKIAMITDSGDITDESFNQITWETCIAYGDANGIEYEYYKPAEDTDEERINAIDLAVSEGANVIVMPGYLFGPAIAEEQDLYPDVSFIAVDVTEGDIVNLAGESVGHLFFPGRTGWLFSRLCSSKRWIYKPWFPRRYRSSCSYPLWLRIHSGYQRCSRRTWC